MADRLVEDQLWRPKNIGKTWFLVKFCDLNESYEFLATDRVNLWTEKLQTSDISRRQTHLNSHIETKVKVIVEHIRSTIGDQRSSGSTLVIDSASRSERPEERLTLRLNSSLHGLSFTWEFHMKREQQQTALRHLLTDPLICMVAELVRRQEILTEMIESKDAQIDDYKAEGVTIARRHKFDAKFNLSEFQREMAQSEEFHHLINLSSMEGAFGPEAGDLLTEITSRGRKDERAAKGLLESGNLPEKSATSAHDVPPNDVPDTKHKEAEEELKRRRDLEENLEKLKRKKEMTKKTKLNL